MLRLRDRGLEVFIFDRDFVTVKVSTAMDFNDSRV